MTPCIYYQPHLRSTVKRATTKKKTTHNVHQHHKQKKNCNTDDSLVASRSSCGIYDDKAKNAPSPSQKLLCEIKAAAAYLKCLLPSYSRRDADVIYQLAAGEEKLKIFQSSYLRNGISLPAVFNPLLVTNHFQAHGCFFQWLAASHITVVVSASHFFIIAFPLRWVPAFCQSLMLYFLESRPLGDSTKALPLSIMQVVGIRIVSLRFT